MGRMNFREEIRKFFKRSLIMCWIAIFICWFMKMFGFDLFGLDMNNSFFNDMDTFMNNHSIIKFIYYVVTLNIQLYLLTCIVQRDKGKKIWLHLLYLCPLTILVRYLTSYDNPLNDYKPIIEMLYLVFVCCKFKLKSIPRSLFAILTLTIYQAISLLTRSLEIQTTSYGFIAIQILSIDLYLLLYSHKEVALMDGNTWIFFGITAWIYAVAGFIVGLFTLHPIKKAKEWHAKGKEIEDARKTKKENKKLAKTK